MDWEIQYELQQTLTLIRQEPFFVGNPLTVEHIHQNLLETDRSCSLELQPDQLARHMAVMGVSGAGKSKFLELLGRHLIDTLNGFTFIDPHGDAARELLAYVVKTKGDDFLDRFHYLEPTSEWCFSFDPFDAPLKDVIDSPHSVEFSNQQHKSVDEMRGVLLRNNTVAEQDIMLLLKRYLTALLTALATPIDESGRRLSLADAYVVLRKKHDWHERIFPLLYDRLPADVRLDFDELHSLSPQKQYEEVRSTLNKVNDFLGTSTKLIFGHHAPSIDLHEIVRNRHVLIVNLKTKDLSRAASRPIAGFIVQELMNACQSITEQGERIPHHLIIDEAGEYLAEDFKDILEECRKYRLSLCVGGQSLSSFRKGENIDLVSDLENHCKTVICFQQRSNEDVYELARYFAKPNYVLYELLQRVDVPDPELDEIITLIDQSTSVSEMKAHTHALTNAISRMLAKSHAKSNASQFAETISRQLARTEGENWSDGEGFADSSMQSSGQGMVHGFQPMHIDGQIVPIPTVSEQGMMGSSSGRTLSDFSSKGGNKAMTNALAKALTLGRAEAIIDGEMEGEGTTRGTMDANTQAQTLSKGQTVKQQLVQRTRTIWLPTGQPRYAIPYQDAMHEYLLTKMPDQFAFARTKLENIEQTVLFRVKDVHPAFEHDDERRTAVAAFLEKLYQRKPYMFRPIHPDQAQQDRLAALMKPVSNKRATTKREQQPEQLNRPTDHHDDDLFAP